MKALVTAGGYATRLFPITKVIPKAMLPLGRKPLIQRVVEELRASGARWVGIMCRPDQATIHEHFQTAARLGVSVPSSGRATLQHEAVAIDSLPPCEILPFEQTTSFSDAMLRAAPWVRGGPFLLALSDEIDSPLSAHTVSSKLVDAFRTFNCTVVAYDRTLVPPDIFQLSEAYHLRQISDLERTPEDLFIVGRFLFADDFLPALTKVKSETGQADYLAALNILGRQRRLVAMPFDGQWLHCGDHKGYQEAFIEFALTDSLLGAGLRRYVDKKLAAVGRVEHTATTPGDADRGETRPPGE